MRAICSVAALVAVASCSFGQEAPRFECNVPIRAITSGPKAHWFGYYDKLQFSPDGTKVLGMEVDFEDRPPTANDSITLGVVHLDDNDRWEPFATTSTWSWQQGCMLQWLPGSDTKVIYNDMDEGQFISRVHDLDTGESRIYSHPMYAVSPDGKKAVTVSFARLDETRPGYGYAGGRDSAASYGAPPGEGVILMDLESGYSEVIVEYAQIVAVDPQPAMTEGKSWLNHLLFSPDGSRFIFLHRWRQERDKAGPWKTRMFTAGADGKDLYNLADHDMVSHFIWHDPEHILAWSKEPESGARFHYYTDQSDAVTVIGDGVLERDGHCTYDPTGEWILTDTYPDSDRMQHLMLYRPSDGKLVKLGKFYMPRTSEAQLRCDLHARWNRDGTAVCIDSLHEGTRQMYLLDVRGTMD